MQRQGSVIVFLSNQLRRDISLGVIKPGEKLNIEGLKRMYNVSHPSVREALSLLVGEGFVGFQESKGFHALDVSQQALQDIIRLRTELECIAFEWSVNQSNVVWRSNVVAAHFALSEIEQRMQEEPSNAALELDARNRAFHLALAENCGSPILLETISQQYDLSRRYCLRAFANDPKGPWMDTSSKDHEELKQSAIEGDVSYGLKILRKHITEATFCAAIEAVKENTKDDSLSQAGKI